jgi:hypothetical protein
VEPDKFLIIEQGDIEWNLKLSWHRPSVAGLGWVLFPWRWLPVLRWPILAMKLGTLGSLLG